MDTKSGFVSALPVRNSFGYACGFPVCRPVCFPTLIEGLVAPTLGGLLGILRTDTRPDSGHTTGISTRGQRGRQRKEGVSSGEKRSRRGGIRNGIYPASPERLPEPYISPSAASCAPNVERCRGRQLRAIPPRLIPCALPPGLEDPPSSTSLLTPPPLCTQDVRLYPARILMRSLPVDCIQAVPRLHHRKQDVSTERDAC
jgi:hypothetical protein